MPRRTKANLSAVDQLGREQHRCVTLAQLAAAGMSEGSIAHRTRPEHGSWTRLLPGVVLLHRGTPTADERAMSALLYAGDGAILTGVEALRRQGLRRLPDDPDVHVLVPHGRRRTSHGLAVIERTRRLPEPLLVNGLTCSPVPRALVDACRRIPRLDQVRALAAEAVQRRLCGEDAILVELRSAQRRRTASLRVVASEITGGIRSAAEADFRAFLASSGFPAPLWNHDLVARDGTFIGCPDAWFDEHGVAAEVDSREWHMDPAGWERTQRRRARFARFGIPTVPVTPRRLYRDRDELARDLWGALDGSRGRPRPDVRAVMRSQAA
jgi:hypothetical protein